MLFISMIALWYSLTFASINAINTRPRGVANLTVVDIKYFEDNLPRGVYSGVSAVNSKNEWIIVGGCNEQNVMESSWWYCSSNPSADSQTYIWNTETNASFHAVNVNPLKSSYWWLFWNPSNGYPFPIIDDIMYIQQHDMFYEFDTIKKAWGYRYITIPQRSIFSCNVFDKVNKKLYVLGGFDNSISNSMLVYDFNSNSWHYMAKMPYAAWGGSCALASRNIYYFGWLQNSTVISNIIKYQIAENIWTELNITLDYKISFGSRVIVVNNNTNILIFGGEENYENTIYLFRTQDESMIAVGMLNEYRYAPQVELINGNVYVTGGLSFLDGNITILKSMETFPLSNEAFVLTKSVNVTRPIVESENNHQNLTTTSFYFTTTEYVNPITSSDPTNHPNSKITFDKTIFLSFFIPGIVIFLASTILLIFSTCPRIRKYARYGLDHKWKTVWRALHYIEKLAILFEIANFIANCSFAVYVMVQHSLITSLFSFSVSVFGMLLFLMKLRSSQILFSNYDNDIRKFQQLSAFNDDESKQKAANIQKSINERQVDLIWFDGLNASIHDLPQCFIIITTSLNIGWSIFTSITYMITLFALGWKMIFRPVALSFGCFDFAIAKNNPHQTKHTTKTPVKDLTIEMVELNDEQLPLIETIEDSLYGTETRDGEVIHPPFLPLNQEQSDSFCTSDSSIEFEEQKMEELDQQLVAELEQVIDEAVSAVFEQPQNIATQCPQGDNSRTKDSKPSTKPTNKQNNNNKPNRNNQNNNNSNGNFNNNFNNNNNDENNDDDEKKSDQNNNDDETDTTQSKTKNKKKKISAKSQSAPNPTTSKLRCNAPPFKPRSRLSSIYEHKSIEQISVIPINYINSGYIQNSFAICYSAPNLPTPSMKQDNSVNSKYDNMKARDNESPSIKSIKKKGKRNKSSVFRTCTSGYVPNKTTRAKGNIRIPKQFSESIIPNTVKESFLNVYRFMDITTSMQFNNNQIREFNYNNGKIRVHCYDFHHKTTGQTLYVVTEKSSQNSHYQYQMTDQLFNAEQMLSKYGINRSQLPNSPRKTKQFLIQLHNKHAILKVLLDASALNILIQKTKWHNQIKVPIFSKLSGKRNMRLSLEKSNFMRQIQQFAQNEKPFTLIPIVMFDDKDQHWVEYVWIITVDNGINIGISLIYNEIAHRVTVNGIHLDKESILKQHALTILNWDEHKCNCLDNFQSTINDFLIFGRPDEDKRRIKELKDDNTELKNENTYLKKQIEQLQAILQNNSPSISNSSPNYDLSGANMIYVE